MIQLVNGRNLTTIHLPTFGKLLRIGLPNTLRGEIWEMCSGSANLRFHHNGEYESILKEYEGSTSLSTEEIEKDLNRYVTDFVYTAQGIFIYIWRFLLDPCQNMQRIKVQKASISFDVYWQHTLGKIQSLDIARQWTLSVQHYSCKTQFYGY